MTKMQALNSFLSGFGLPAYEENSIYSSSAIPSFPYITYSVSFGNIYGNDAPLTASIWYRTLSWQAIEQKADEISAYLGMQGKVIQCDDGYIWIKRGSPFAQTMGDSTDDLVKRILINLSVTYYTTV